MDRLSGVLTFLREGKEHVSGDFISSRLAISRTAVWKYVNQLEKLGYKIDKVKGKGYRLIKAPDRPYPWEVKRHLATESMGKEVVYKETIESTNTHAFRLALEGAPEGTCVIAETQKSGKGRLNRQWFSPSGRNLYVSVILRPQVHPSKVAPITFLSSLAVYDTIESLAGQKPTLKWPNDVLMNGRKLCGTLLELSTEAELVRFVVVGIGFNINMKGSEIEEGLRQKATSLFVETKKSYERAYVCGTLLTNLEAHYKVFTAHGEGTILDLWQERAGLNGKHVEIVQMGERYSGIVEGIDRDGGMLLRTDGVVKKIIAGDVTF
jgi:BirA family transcriptional regulator, biotin operon repressor / biotin---[acetyl-CoA-carboxylase] ligase